MRKFMIPIAILIGLIFYLRNQNHAPAPEPSVPVVPALPQEAATAPPVISPVPHNPAPVEIQTTHTDTDTFFERLAKATDVREVFGQPYNHVVAIFHNGDWITMGDILVNESQLISDADNSDVKIARIAKVEYWPRGIVPYEIDSHLDKARVKAAMAEISQSTSVRFVEYSGEPDYLSFRSSEQVLCLSFLGKQGGEQEIKLHASECEVGSIVHEILHALGFVHEHSREDRDTYVDVLWDNIEPPYLSQFQKMPAPISIPVTGSFDFDSIMLYDATAFAIPGRASLRKKDGSTFTANRKGLSPKDIAKIKLLYPSKKPKAK